MKQRKKRIFHWYCVEKKGLGEIADILNRDRNRYPPPVPNPKDESGLPRTWSRSTIQAILRNPKYTGYNVWNRHDKRRGRRTLRPREDWSSEPTHPPIVAMEVYRLVEGAPEANANLIAGGESRPYVGNQRKTGRFYPTAGHAFCALCGCRLEGSFQRHKHWMRCQYVQRRGEVAALVAGHPRSLQVKEQAIIDAVLDFLGRRVFGPDRIRLLGDELLGFGDEPQGDGQAAVNALRGKLADTQTAIYRQSLRLEEHDDPAHPVVAAAPRRIEELAGEQKELEARIAHLEKHPPKNPDRRELERALRSIPDLRDTLVAASPEELAEIFDAFEIRAVYDRRDQSLDITATVIPELWDETLPKRQRPANVTGRRTSSIAGAGFEPATFGL
jgi:site-specific DNA recombinase